MTDFDESLRKTNKKTILIGEMNINLLDICAHEVNAYNEKKY